MLSGYLKYLNEYNYKWKMNEVCTHAASSGHLECLRYVMRETRDQDNNELTRRWKKKGKGKMRRMN